MNQQINTIIISSSYIISKALLEIIPNYFNKIEFIDKCDDFDILLNKIEKNNLTLIFIDETFFEKFQFFIENNNEKTIIVPIVIHELSIIEKVKFTINLFDNVNQIKKVFSKIVDYIDTKIKEPLLDKELSNRELAILQMIARGFTSKQIGDKLGISPQTVSSHRKNISSKLEIKTVSGLTVYAILNNLISVDEAKLS